MTVSFFQANLIFESTARIKTVQGAPLREGRVFLSQNYTIPQKLYYSQKLSNYKQSSLICGSISIVK
jgi:hypothetical protein